MKLESKKDARLEIRLSEEDLFLLKLSAYLIGQSVSSLLRMFIDSTLNNLRMKIEMGEIDLDYYTSYLNDKL